MSILIQNANIVNWDRVIKNTNVGIKDGIIDCIGDCDASNYDEIIDAKNKVVMPGLVNSHTHAGMTIFRNLVSDIPLDDWLFNNIIPMEAKLTKEDIYWGTMLAIAEMIKGGTTTFADMYYHMDEVAKVVTETGIRANISKSILSMQKGVSSIPKDLSLEREFFYKWNNSSNGRIKVYIEIHSAYMYDRKSLILASNFAKDLGTGIHIHVAETKSEQEMCYKKYNMDAVNILNECGVFDVPTLAAHCVHLSDDNINVLKEKHVSVSHNITSNLKLGSGIARIPDMLDKGINISLGTDGCASNDNLNLFEEMHLVALVHKGVLCDSTVLKAKDVLRMATICGAKALGFTNLGTIKKGNTADIIIVDIDKIHNSPNGNYSLGLLYSAQASDVDTVIVDGKILMKNRELLTIDEELVKYNTNRIRDRLSR